MSLTEQGRKNWNKMLRQDGLDKVREKWSQGDYDAQGNFARRYIEMWIKSEEEKISLRPSRQANRIAIIAAAISLLILIANILLFIFSQTTKIC